MDLDIFREFADQLGRTGVDEQNVSRAREERKRQGALSCQEDV